jgi:hypothetical protein
MIKRLPYRMAVRGSMYYSTRPSKPTDDDFFSKIIMAMSGFFGSITAWSAFKDWKKK